MAYALIFSGQGMQHAGMLPWLANDATVEHTCSLLGVSDWRAQLGDARWAFQNLHAQVLLTGLGLAAWGQLAPALPAPAAVAGYSVGELASFCAAGVYDADTALLLARARAQAMDRCAAIAPGGLLAVSGLAPAQVQALCQRYGLEIAIDNDSHAVVLGGPEAALDGASAAARAQGAQLTRLHVGLASHTRWMDAAAREFAALLEPMAWRAPRVPLYGNALDRVTRPAQAQQALAQQIATTVRWSACMESLHARRVDCVLEVGPGAALARMWTQRYPEIPARSVDEFVRASGVVDWIMRHSRD